MSKNFFKGWILKITEIIVASAFIFSLLTNCSSVYMKGTPLYEGEYSKPQSPPEERINLWPLFYYHEPAMSILWPLGEITDDHFAIRPVFSVYKLDKKEHEYDIFWPLVEFDFDTNDHRIFPFFWGGRNAVHPYFIAFPVLWWSNDFKGISPLIWWESGFSFLPFIWYDKDNFFHFFPLWLNWKKNQAKDLHLLWPIFRWMDKKDHSGFRVWPFVGRYKKSNNKKYTYVLWPLYHFMHDNKAHMTTRVAFPFYFQHTKGDDNWWLLLPIIFQHKDKEERMTVTPLWCMGEKSKAYWHTIFPLYYYSVDSSQKTNRWLTPLIGKATSPNESKWFFFPLLSSVAWGDHKKDVWMLAPLMRFQWGHGNVQNHILPIYAYDRNNNMVLTPLISWQKDKNEGFINLLILLAHYSYKSAGQKAFHLIPPLIGADWEKEAGLKHIRAYPLFSWNRRGEHETSLWVIPWLSFETSPNLRKNKFFPIWNYSKRTHSGEKMGHDIDFSLLGWLYDYRARIKTPQTGKGDEHEEYIRARILWRLMHYERKDNHKTFDLFPFITYDRDKKSKFKKFSFAWRLFRYERQRNGELDLDLFFIPLQRSRQKED